MRGIVDRDADQSGAENKGNEGELSENRKAQAQRNQESPAYGCRHQKKRGNAAEEKPRKENNADG